MLVLMLINVPLLLNVTNQILYRPYLELNCHLSDGTPKRLCCQSEWLQLFEQMKSNIEKDLYVTFKSGPVYTVGVETLVLHLPPGCMSRMYTFMCRAHLNVYEPLFLQRTLSFLSSKCPSNTW